MSCRLQVGFAGFGLHYRLLVNLEELVLLSYLPVQVSKIFSLEFIVMITCFGRRITFATSNFEVVRSFDDLRK